MKKFIVLTLVMVLMSVHALGVVSAATTEPLVQATFSTNPTTIAPGNDGYIQLTLKNSGTAAANRIKISRASWDPSITPSGTWVNELGALGVGDSTTALYKFSVSSTASSGLYTVNFNIDYCQDSSCRTINPNAIINVQSPSTLELTSISPSSLRPGERTNMTFTIANKGSSSINNIVFTWTSSSNLILPLGSDNRVIIPVISVNSYYDIQTQVSVSPSAISGVYPLSISIQYSDKSGANQTISSTAGIEIGGETDFDVSVQDSTASSTTLAITNIGASTAYSVIVSIPQQENFRVTGTSTNVMGNLNAGDYTLTSFQITQVSGFQITPTRNATNISTSQQRNLIVEISYTDTLGVRRTVQKEVSQNEFGSITNTTFGEGMRTRTAQGGQSQIFGGNGLLYIGIGIVGIIAIVAFLKFRKKINILKSGLKMKSKKD
jgi:hypothetical protein